MSALVPRSERCFLLFWAVLTTMTLGHNAWSKAPVDGGVISGLYGCSVRYEFHRAPEPISAGSAVILAHGFMRDLGSMRGWARHWSNAGIDTVVLSLCNSTLLNGHHRKNADDIVNLRHYLDIRHPIYAGYSAGGLSAYLAALGDDQAVAYLGLDSVDSGDLALRAPAGLQVPALFLLAGPSICNAQNNFEPVLEKMQYRNTIRVHGSTHCDFENPLDKRCTWLCGGGSDEMAESVQGQIVERTTAWLKSVATNESR
jgi:pimeloyl-ACP methyl ester carboxylesterase